MDYNDVAAIVHIVNDVLEAEDQNEQVGERRFYLKENPFERSERCFIKNFRLTKDLVREVVDLVTPYVQPPSRRSALSIESKVSKYFLKLMKHLLLYYCDNWFL